MKFNIRSARERAGLTQADLAAKLGVNPVTLSGYETGKHDPKSDILVLIAQICNVSVDYLLGRNVDSPAVASDKVINSNSYSERAMQLAALYDSLTDAGKDIIDKSAEIAELHFKMVCKPVNRIPIIGTAYQDGRVEMRLAARQERKELESEASPVESEQLEKR